MNIPAITTNQMRVVDQMMIEDYKIELIQMMENAGRNLAALSQDVFLENNPVGKRINILVGSGGNGGGCMVAARHLHNRGARVIVYTTKKPSEYKGVPGHQLNILSKMGVPLIFADAITELPDANLILDGLIGYSLNGSPRGYAAHLINLANERDYPILSLDVPSGLDSTSGIPYDPHIISSATLTLALPKVGLIKNTAKSSVGELYLADISVPMELYDDMGIKVGPIFAENEIIRL